MLSQAVATASNLVLVVWMSPSGSGWSPVYHFSAPSLGPTYKNPPGPASLQLLPMLPLFSSLLRGRRQPPLHPFPSQRVSFNIAVHLFMQPFLLQHPLVEASQQPIAVLCCRFGSDASARLVRAQPVLPVLGSAEGLLLVPCGPSSVCRSGAWCLQTSQGSLFRSVSPPVPILRWCLG